MPKYVQQSFGAGLAESLSQWLPMMLSVLERQRAEKAQRVRDLLYVSQLDPHNVQEVLKKQPWLANYLGGGKKTPFVPRAHTPEEITSEAEAASKLVTLPYREAAEITRLKAEQEVAPLVTRAQKAATSRAESEADIEAVRASYLKSPSAAEKLTVGLGLTPQQALTSRLTDEELTSAAQIESKVGPAYERLSADAWRTWLFNTYKEGEESALVQKNAGAWGIALAQGNWDVLPKTMRPAAAREAAREQERINTANAQISWARREARVSGAFKLRDETGGAVSLTEAGSAIDALLAGKALSPEVEKLAAANAFLRQSILQVELAVREQELEKTAQLLHQTGIPLEVLKEVAGTLSVIQSRKGERGTEAGALLGDVIKMMKPALYQRMGWKEDEAGKETTGTSLMNRLFGYLITSGGAAGGSAVGLLTGPIGSVVGGAVGGGGAAYMADKSTSQILGAAVGGGVGGLVGGPVGAAKGAAMESIGLDFLPSLAKLIGVTPAVLRDAGKAMSTGTTPQEDIAAILSGKPSLKGAPPQEPKLTLSDDQKVFLVNLARTLNQGLPGSVLDAPTKQKYEKLLDVIESVRKGDRPYQDLMMELSQFYK